MKAAIYKGKKIIDLENINLPEISEGEALIKVFYSGICGTDIHTYNGEYRTIPPMVLGHEFSGEIIEVNPKQKNIFKSGDKVVAKPTINCGSCYACKKGYFNVCKNLKMLGIDYQGAFAEYIKVPLDILYKIPEGVSLKAAALAEPLAVAVHAVRRSNIKVGDNTVVFGAGPIGILIGIIAKISGVDQVIIADVNDFRVNKAGILGLDAINIKNIDFIKYVDKKTSGNMADVAFDAAGVSETAEIITDVTSIKGQIVVASVFKKSPTINLFSLLFKEQNIIGIRVYLEEDFIKALSILKGHPEIEEIITDIIPLSKVSEAIEGIIKGGNSLKVLIELES